MAAGLKGPDNAHLLIGRDARKQINFVNAGSQRKLVELIDLCSGQQVAAGQPERLNKVPHDQRRIARDDLDPHTQRLKASNGFRGRMLGRVFEHAMTGEYQVALVLRRRTLLVWRKLAPGDRETAKAPHRALFGHQAKTLARLWVERGRRPVVELHAG
jgi:hypothetical protein